MLSNQDAFAVDTGGQLTQDAVVAQIAAKVAELCGHDEGSPEEPLSSFGLTSISVAELGAFIRMQFNHQVSALELMTTATCLSLAEAIMQGDQSGDEDDAAAARPPHTVGLLQRPRRPLPQRRRGAYGTQYSSHRSGIRGLVARPGRVLIAAATRRLIATRSREPTVGRCSLTYPSEWKHRFSNVRHDEAIPMYARADLALYNSHGRLTAIVEVKSKMRTSSEWAALTRRNILAHGDFSGADFFLLVTPDRMYIWKDAGTDPVPVPPTYEADMTTEFAPYFESVGVSPEEVSGLAFELVVGAWLGDVMRSARRTGEDTDTLRRLIDSGLRTAVMDGRLEYEAVV